MWRIATSVTAPAERLAAPMPSQSEMLGFMYPYNATRTAYMFMNVASEAMRYAERQRHENANRIAASPNSGYR